jgi:hypothetical protein
MNHGLIAGEGKDFYVIQHLDGLRSQSSVLFRYQGALVLEVKLPGCEDNFSPPSNAEVKNE